MKCKNIASYAVISEGQFLLPGEDHYQSWQLYCWEHAPVDAKPLTAAWRSLCREAEYDDQLAKLECGIHLRIVAEGVV